MPAISEKSPSELSAYFKSIRVGSDLVSVRVAWFRLMNTTQEISIPEIGAFVQRLVKAEETLDHFYSRTFNVLAVDDRKRFLEKEEAYNAFVNGVISRFPEKTYTISL